MYNKRRFLFQALLMTGVSLLLRSVGVSAQIIIASKIGAEAVGVSSLINGVGGFAVTLALSGIQLGCTRLCAEGLGKKDVGFVRTTLRCAIGHALFFGLLAGAILWLCAPWIGQYWLHDLRTLPSLKIFAVTLPFVALSCCFAGYFVAVRRVYKSACIQVMEEVLRIGCTLILLNRMVSGGLESALLALAISNAIADLFSGLALTLLYRNDRRKHFPPSSRPPTRASYVAVARRLLSITMPVAVAAYARSGLITLEHMLIPLGLEQYGQTHAASLASYGIVHSMALPVVLFPCALLSSFAGLMIPEVTEAYVRGELARIRAMTKRVFSLTLFYSIGVSGIMVALSYEIGSALYGNQDAATYIRLLAPLIPIMYMDSATDALLKGLGEQVYSMKVNILDAAVSVLLVWLLTPLFGIMGYVIAIYATELLNASLSIVRLLNVSQLRPCVSTWVIKPLACVVGATSLTKLVYHILPVGLTPIGRVSELVILICIAAILYISLMLIFGAIRRQDIQWMGSFFLKETSSRTSK